jgi:adenylate cyclase
LPDDTPLQEPENERNSNALASLANILKYGLATASDRQKRLLQYLVTEELEGRGDLLKAAPIATGVLGRSADFDPQTDSIVRVEMGRLRQALELYYATHGAKDPVRIKFEKGSYRPKFERIANGKPPRTPQRYWIMVMTAVLVAVITSVVLLTILAITNRPEDQQGKLAPIRSSPRVAVAPVAFSSDAPGLEYFAAGIQGEIVGILSEFDWLTVFPLLSDQAIDKAVANVMGHVDYVVRTSAQIAHGKLAVWVLVTEGKTGAVLWSNRYESPIEGTGLFDVQRTLAIRIASDIGNPLGFIVSLEKTRIVSDSFRTSEGFDCYLRALSYFSRFDRAAYQEAHSCAEAAAKTASNDANALALFALLELSGQILGYDGVASPERRANAVRLADNAFRLNEVGFLPRMGSYAAAVCEGDEERFRRISALAVRDYPNNPTVLFDVARRMLLGTNAQTEAMQLLDRANKLNPENSTPYGVLKAFDDYRRSQNNEMILSALNLSSGRLPPPLLVIEMALRTHAGDREGVERLRRSLQTFGFTNDGEFLALIGRECWTDEVKKTIRQLLAAK